MSRDSNIGAWIQFARFTEAAGEMAPFPYIKGVAGCMVTILEVVERAGKNNEDLRDLAESIGGTIRIIKETVEAHGYTSATRFRDVCVELQRYLESLIAELKSTQRKLNSKRIMRLLTTKKVASVINGYRQRVNDIKADFVVLATTNTTLTVSEMHDALSVTVKSEARCIQSEICSLGEIQRENTGQICEKLQDLRGYYKGQIREFVVGDIYIRDVVSHSTWGSGLEYKDNYGTVGCCSTTKLIRVYQNTLNNEEAILKKLTDAADTLINLRHPNIVQVFGICRSSKFPAIIFHGSTYIRLTDYQHNLTAKDFIQFYIQLFHDLESVAEYVLRHNMPLFNYHIATGDIHLNEHRKIVLMDIPFNSSSFGLILMSISGSQIYWAPLLTSLPEEPLPSEIDRGWSSLALRMGGLQIAYDIISYSSLDITSRICPSLQHYAPGSILTSHGMTLVGRVPTSLDKWVVSWWLEARAGELLCPSTDPEMRNFKNGFINLPLPYAGIRVYSIEIFLSSFRRMFGSWMAQISQLRSCIRSRVCVDDDLVLIYTDFVLRIEPVYDSSRLCDTFMAEDHHSLLLSIRAPIQHENNELSWLFTWYDGDSEISRVEVEEIFGTRISIERCWSMHSVSKTLLTTIPELNADYGFDPARGGADVCECFGWPLMEILDVSTGDWISLHGTVSQSALITSNETSRISTVSALDNGLEVDHAGQASAKTEIGSAMQTTYLKWYHGPWVFIVIPIVIGVVMLYFRNEAKEHRYQSTL